MKSQFEGVKFFGAVLVASALAQSPLAAQLALQTVGQGSYAFNSGYPLTPALHQSTLFNLLRSPPDAAERNIVAGYVAFELPAFDGSITSAVLTLNYSGAFREGDGVGPIGLNTWDVDTPLNVLTSGPFDVPVSSDPAFDLQSGQLFGSGGAETGVFQMKTVSLSLNAAFLQQANVLSGGGILALGLALAPPMNADEYSLQLLTAQAGDAHVQLHVEFSDGSFTPVPEASTFGLAGVFLIAGVIVLRRRLHSAWKISPQLCQ